MNPYTILRALLISFLIMFYTSSCNSTEPTDDLKPGRRDYTWTIDTLNIPFTTLQRIWGSSPSDVWAIGPGGDKDKTIYHFNGTRWSTDGINRPLAPTSIYGFGRNNVWIGGRGGEIWNFDGSIWVKTYSLNITGYNFFGFENIWGDNENNIYAVGYAEDSVRYKGTIIKYDGILWKNLEIQEVQNSFVKILRGSESSNNYFILGYRIEPFAEDSSFIYEFDGQNLELLYKGITSPEQLADIYLIKNKIYLAEGLNIFAIDKNSKNFVVKIPAEATLWGRNQNDILIGLENGIAHYNGDNIEYVYHFSDPNIFITGGVVFENEIFILSSNSNNGLNIVYRGILK